MQLNRILTLLTVYYICLPGGAAVGELDLTADAKWQCRDNDQCVARTSCAQRGDSGNGN